MRCNSMLHFGRDEGVEMVVAYHGVISTVRLQGKCAWDFLGEFFKNKILFIIITFLSKEEIQTVRKDQGSLFHLLDHTL